ncbi:hypothetical protein WICPIJ_004603 [Wickerhamomyces pijperi]|uniref:Telomere replication protein EST3 n=1 Tax=Wickerhamomyces pijperi TaxID=599730 RepID=A0A9P8Q7D5_WICPI|nr:hypothetical protein WICPIJ_004603 [Wickerhamomyces pijperi]
MITKYDDSIPKKYIKSRGYLNPWFFSYFPLMYQPGYTPAPAPAPKPKTKHAKLLQVFKLLSVNPLNPYELLYSMSDSNAVVFVIMSRFAIDKFESKECIRLTKLCKPNKIIMMTDFKIEWIERRRFGALFGKFVPKRYHENLEIEVEYDQEGVNKSVKNDTLYYAVIRLDGFDIYNHDEIPFTGNIPLVYDTDWYQKMIISGKFDHDKVLLEEKEFLC